jgi:hypothetical protein
MAQLLTTNEAGEEIGASSRGVGASIVDFDNALRWPCTRAEFSKSE